MGSVRKGFKDKYDDNISNGHAMQHHRLPGPYMTSSPSPSSDRDHLDDFAQKTDVRNNLHDKYGDLHHQATQAHEIANHDHFGCSIFKGSDCEKYGSNPLHRVKKSHGKK